MITTKEKLELIEASRNPFHPLHEMFEWDTAKAAQRYFEVIAFWHGRRMIDVRNGGL